MTVVEVGPGKGSYTLEVARRVAPGTVYACDVSPFVVDRLQERVARKGIGNVQVRIDDIQDLYLGDYTVDRVLMIATLGEIPEPVAILRECKRILRSGGLVCLSELLPDPDYPLRGTEKRWAAEAGLVLDGEYGNFFVYQLHFKKL
jgi:ubiquinone/menaquinone biosynthesis C-methylase UbiE